MDERFCFINMHVNASYRKLKRVIGKNVGRMASVLLTQHHSSRGS